MPLDGGAAVGAGPLEAGEIVGVGVRDVELSVRRVDDHVEEDRTDAGMDGRLGEGGDVHREDVLVGKREANAVVPVAAQLVLEAAVHRVPLHDETDLRRVDVLVVVDGAGIAARQVAAPEAAGRGDAVARAGPGAPEPVADDSLADGGGLVAGMEARHVDGAAVGAHRQGARLVGEEGQDPEGRSAEGRPEVRRIEDPRVGASDARRGELGIAGPRHPGDRGVRALLAPMGGGDEDARADGSGRVRHHDVAGLVAHEQGAGHRLLRDAHDADAVRQLVDDPHLVVRQRHERHRLEADGDGRHRLEDQRIAQVEDLEIRVRNVHDEEARAVGRQRDGAHRIALEGHEVALGEGDGRPHEQTEQSDDSGESNSREPRRHASFLMGESRPGTLALFARSGAGAADSESPFGIGSGPRRGGPFRIRGRRGRHRGGPPR